MKTAKFTRTILVTNSVYATGNYTWTTSTPHSLVSGDTFTFYDSGYHNKLVTATCIAGTTGSTIVFTDANADYTIPHQIVISSFPTGFFGYSDVKSMSTGDVTFQATIVGSGTVSGAVTVQVSNDGLAWLNQTTITLNSATSPNSDGHVITAPWLYARLNVTSVTGSSAKLYVTYCGMHI